MEKTNWIKTSDRLPAEGSICITARLNRFENAEWEWALIPLMFLNNKWEQLSNWNGAFIPDYWIPFPPPPIMTKQEQKRSNACAQNAKMEKIKILKKDLEILEGL